MRKVYEVLLTLLIAPAFSWSQSTLNFIAMPETGPAGLAVVNPTTAAASVTFTAYRVDGSLLATSAQTVPAGGQIAKLTTDLFPTAVTSRGGLRGWIQMTSTTPGLQGFMIFGDFATFVAGMDGATPSMDQVMSASGATLVGVVNPGTSAASITIKAYDSNGVEIGTTLVRPVPAKGVYDSEIHDSTIYGTTDQFGGRFPGAAQFASVSHVRITATVPVAGGALLGLSPDNNKKDTALLNGTDVGTAPTELNFPHVVNGALGTSNYTTSVAITNPSASAQIVTLTLNLGSGTPLSVQWSIPANGSLQRTLKDLFGLPDSFQGGWLQVRGPSPLTGFVSYTDLAGGGTDVVPVQASPKTSLVFAHIADLPPWWTGLALLNTSTTAANVEVFAINSNGTLIGGAQNVSTASFTLAAQTKDARLLQQFIPATQSRSGDGGFVFVRTTNNVPLFGIELFFLRSGAAIANVPAGILPEGITYTPPN